MNSTRKRNLLITVALISVSIIAFLGGLAWRSYMESIRPSIENVSELRPFETSWETINGPPISVDDLLGKRTLVNFWGSWCPPCVEEMPLLNEFHTKYANRNFQVIGFAVDSEEAAKQFLEENSIQFSSLIADESTLVEILDLHGNTERVLPLSVLYSENGDLETTHLGVLSSEQLTQFVE